MQFGENDGNYFEGSLLASDPINNTNSIFVLESAKLAKLDFEAMQYLKHARIIITDSQINFIELCQKLKAEILKDEEQWRDCAHVRFMLLENPDDIAKLLKILESGSTFKNEDKTDRAFFLGQLLKNLDHSIWENVSKDKLRRKFADFEPKWSTKMLKYMVTPATLERLITKNYSESEAIEKCISMHETIEKIRQGQFDSIEEEEKADSAVVQVQEEQKQHQQ